MYLSRVEACTMGFIGTLAIGAIGVSLAIQSQVDDRIYALFDATLKNVSDTQGLVADIQNLYSVNYLNVSRAMLFVGVMGACNVSASLLSRCHRRRRQYELLEERNEQNDLKLLKLFHTYVTWGGIGMLIGGSCLGTLFTATWLR